jgi:hypothetical protein
MPRDSTTERFDKLMTAMTFGKKPRAKGTSVRRSAKVVPELELPKILLKMTLRNVDVSPVYSAL